jgi:hypothetical protein
VIARRTGEVWYVAGINADEEATELKMKLPFIDHANGILVTEADAPRSFALSNVILEAEKSTTVTLRPNGGFVMRFNPSETIKTENE